MRFTKWDSLSNKVHASKNFFLIQFDLQHSREKILVIRMILIIVESIISGYMSFLGSTPAKVKYVKNIQFQVSTKFFLKIAIFSHNITLCLDSMEVGNR